MDFQPFLVCTSLCKAKKVKCQVSDEWLTTLFGVEPMGRASLWVDTAWHTFAEEIRLCCIAAEMASFLVGWKLSITARVATILGLKGGTSKEKPSTAKKQMATCRSRLSCSWLRLASIQPVGAVMRPLTSVKGMGGPSWRLLSST